MTERERAKLVEAVARVIARAYDLDPEDDAWEVAQAALAAIDASGTHKIVDLSLLGTGAFTFQGKRFWVAMTCGGHCWEVRTTEGRTLAECRHLEPEHANAIAEGLELRDACLAKRRESRDD